MELTGLEYDHKTGNYKATETAAADFCADVDNLDPNHDDVWRDESGQLWVDGNVVAECNEWGIEHDYSGFRASK